jgi:hypothetical protein
MTQDTKTGAAQAPEIMKDNPPESDEIPYNSLPIRRQVEERPTEDDLAQAALGGPKGNPALPAAPLTKSEQEQNLFTDEPGHVA